MYQSAVMEYANKFTAIKLMLYLWLSCHVGWKCGLVVGGEEWNVQVDSYCNYSNAFLWDSCCHENNRWLLLLLAANSISAGIELTFYTGPGSNYCIVSLAQDLVKVANDLGLNGSFPCILWFLH